MPPALSIAANPSPEIRKDIALEVLTQSQSNTQLANEAWFNLQNTKVKLLLRDKS